MIFKSEIMDNAAFSRAITRIAHEIIERNKGVDNIVLIGIHRRGVPLAHEIAARIETIEHKPVAVGTLDITLYRDDLTMLSDHPVVNGSDIMFSVAGKSVVLIDDVLFSGRTVRAALNAICDLGRPASIQLAVMIDRGHREFPIKADYVGKNVPTSKNECVSVNIEPLDSRTNVEIYSLK